VIAPPAAPKPSFRRGQGPPRPAIVPAELQSIQPIVPVLLRLGETFRICFADFVEIQAESVGGTQARGMPCAPPGKGPDPKPGVVRREEAVAATEDRDGGPRLRRTMAE